MFGSEVLSQGPVLASKTSRQLYQSVASFKKGSASRYEYSLALLIELATNARMEVRIDLVKNIRAFVANSEHWDERDLL